MELGAFRLSEPIRGSPGHPPHMMLALLIYGHAQGMLSALIVLPQGPAAAPFIYTLF